VLASQPEEAVLDRLAGLVPGPSPAAVRAVAGGADALDLLDSPPRPRGITEPLVPFGPRHHATASTSVTVEPGVAPLAAVPAWDQLAQPADVLALPVRGGLRQTWVMEPRTTDRPRPSPEDLVEGALARVEQVSNTPLDPPGNEWHFALGVLFALGATEQLDASAVQRYEDLIQGQARRLRGEV
jgi:hypothetical protein